jgi:cell division septation protein DedD
MKRTGLWMAAACLLAASPWGAPAVADVQAGVKAYHEGDFKRAIDEWMPAAAKNDPDALFNLGQVYRLGKGVTPDLEVAEQYYERAADLGHAVAQANLGALYLDRKGPLYDPKKGISWLEKASFRGNALARYMLGVIYFNGEYVPDDYVEAYAWISLSAGQGVADAVKAEQTVVSQLSLQQISAGKLRAEAIEKQTEETIAAAGGSKPAAERKPVEEAKPAETSPAETKVASTTEASAPSSNWVDPDKRPAPAAETVAVTTPPAAPASEPTADTAGYTPISGFGIQIASLKTEEGAKQTWKALMAAHSDLLGGLAVNVERADLGDKGVYYRLQAGSFASLDEAKAMCGKLKDANVSCLPISR